jgi:hypothetical protein
MSQPDLTKQVSHTGDPGPQKSEITDTLIRQVDTMIQRDMSGNNELGPMTSYSKMY